MKWNEINDNDPDSGPPEGESVLLWFPDVTSPKDGGFSWHGYKDGSRYYAVNNGDYCEGGYGRSYECGPGDYERPTHWLRVVPPRKQYKKLLLLSEDAQVGNTVFRRGCSTSIVIEAAQNFYKHKKGLNDDNAK